MKFADPRNDLAFKKIFGNENKKDILISFLNAILGLTGERTIKEVEMANPYQLPPIHDLKNTLLDVRATDKLGRQFLVEMQVERDPLFAKRSLYYTSKSYVSQIESGSDYGELKKVYFIGILDFSTFECESYLSRHLILDRKTFANELRDFEFAFVELGKFHLSIEECTDTAAKWVYFIKNARNLDWVPEEYKGEPAFEKAFEAAMKFNWNKKELEVYDSIAMNDAKNRSIFKYTMKEILEQGMEQGIEQGIKQGIEQGIEQGMEKSRLKIAVNLLDVLDDSTIAQKTGFEIEAVKELRKKHQADGESTSKTEDFE